MNDRQAHQQAVLSFLNREIKPACWRLEIPGSTGNENYFAFGENASLFIKLGVDASRYQAASEAGLTPPVLACGWLEDGTSIMVQPLIEGRTPSRIDFQERLGAVAEVLRRLQHSPELGHLLPRPPSELYRDVGLARLEEVHTRWQQVRPLVPQAAGFVDDSLHALAGALRKLQGSGLVISHGDICNGNWLFASDGRLYLLDLASLAWDDPAADLGALLWWYYPPTLRPRFLHIAGYAANEELNTRMRLRMALHCLHITLPRPGSFDALDPEGYAARLQDFRAVMAGQENPQGYDD
jgi:thiamine kinase-like enzyme